jgi:hypothetical protein
MAYSIDRAALLASQLERFAHSNVHQLAGQVANLDFWLDEAAHALRVLDEYPQRFRRLRDAQVGWVEAHGTKVSDYCPICRGGCEFGPQTPPAPTRIPAEQIEEARVGLRHSAYRFLLRCHRSGQLDQAAVRAACERIAVVAEPEDLEGVPADSAGAAPTIGEAEQNATRQDARSRGTRRRR